MPVIGEPTTVGDWQTADGLITPQAIRNRVVPGAGGGTPAGSVLTRNGTVFELSGVPVMRFGIRAANVLERDDITQHFIDNMASMMAHGIQGVTLFLQGGRSSWTALNNSTFNAYNADGSIKSEYATRLDWLLTATAAVPMMVAVGCFYRGRDQELSGTTAVKDAVVNTMTLMEGHDHTWLMAMNEPNHSGYDLPILNTAAGQQELYAHIKQAKPDMITYVSHEPDANDGFLADSWGRNGVGSGMSPGDMAVEYYVATNETSTMGGLGAFSSTAQNSYRIACVSAFNKPGYFYTMSRWQQVTDQTGFPRFDKGGAGTAEDPGMGFIWDRMKELQGV